LFNPWRRGRSGSRILLGIIIAVVRVVPDAAALHPTEPAALADIGRRPIWFGVYRAQICGGVVDRRADIYSLGCLLYELVTGRPPFRGDSSSEIAERQMKREPVAPSHLIADVPSRLDDLILSMLEKLPERRPDDAAQIGRRLGEIARRAQQVPVDYALFQEVRRGMRADFVT
jgi:serine/threonine protein kinase